MKILFICRGNVGRSQMAKALANKYLSIDAMSAGTRVPTEGPGKEGMHLEDIPVAAPVIRCLREMEGIDVSRSQNKQLTPAMLTGMDKVVVMAELETWPDFLKESDLVEYWEIEDPFNRSYAFYGETLRQIKTRVLKLLS
jgi:protein-tyrosine-phosphatase